MQDSLFSQPRRAAQAAEPAADRVEGVSRIVDYIKRWLEQNKNLGAIRVRGEVSGLRERSGRLYFDLKENADVLKCVAWQNDAAKLPAFKDGAEIVCGGQFTAYTRYSQYQLMVKSVELSGVGALFAQFEKLKEQFRDEGLFEPERKRKIDLLPRRIAVISAEQGKGAEDFFTIIAREAPFVHVTLIETRVQGEGAEIDIGAAIDRAARMGIDAVVVTRGGGSYEDLFPFNREPVVRAIVRSKKPVITAIGHTGDVHLCDLVADYNPETPSAAAHWFGERGVQCRRRVAQGANDLAQAASALVRRRTQSYDYATAGLQKTRQWFMSKLERTIFDLERRLNFQTPQGRLAARQQRLSALRSQLDAARYFTAPRRERLGRAVSSFPRLHSAVIRDAVMRLTRLDTRLNDLSPAALLQRGYAIVMFEGRAVRDAAAVPAGAQVEAHLQRGKLIARVEGKTADA